MPTSTTSGTSNTQTQYIPDPGVMSVYGNMEGTVQGLANYLINNYVQFPQASVAAPGDLMSQYWNLAGTNANAPDMTGFQRGMTDIGSASINQYVDPNQINLNQNYNFQPGQIQLPNTFANGTPNVSAPGGVSGLASYYQVNPQQVSGPTVNAQQVSAPGAINPITGLMQVTAPQLQQYQMAQAQQVNAPNLQNFTMQAAADVAPNAQVATQSWTDPGTAAQYMSPYTQQVVQAQQAYATQAYQQQREQEKGQAAQAGAFGGTREAVEQASTISRIRCSWPTSRRRGCRTLISRASNSSINNSSSACRASSSMCRAGCKPRSPISRTSSRLICRTSLRICRRRASVLRPACKLSLLTNRPVSL